MNQLKEIPITQAMLPGFRRMANFPRFALGEASKEDDADIWVAHLHKPELVARIVIHPAGVRLEFLPVQPAVRDVAGMLENFILPQSLFDDMARYSGTDDMPLSYDLFKGNPPKHLALHDPKSNWMGFARLESPVFVAASGGESILPLEPCDDISPYLGEAKPFSLDWLE
jgi:hypothetical protein